MQGLREFTSNCGHPTQILSDNGKYFKAADRELARLLRQIGWNNIREMSKFYGTKWTWSSPYGPNQNGLIERIIAGIKFSLRVALKSVNVPLKN